MDIVFNKTLILIEDLVFLKAGHGLKQYGLPTPSLDRDNDSPNRELIREVAYNVIQLSEMVNTNEPKLNSEQRYVYNTLITSVHSKHGQIFFFDAPGGTGKTFLINLLLAKVRKDKTISIEVASSGTAATLLSGGKTAHSALKMPLDLNRHATQICNISKPSDMAKVLQMRAHCVVRNNNGSQRRSRGT